MTKITNKWNPSYEGDDKRWISWDDKNLKEITRLRYMGGKIGGESCWELSYCKGIHVDGREMFVSLHSDLYEIPKGKGMIQKTIIKSAKDDKVYAKGLNIFNVISLHY